MSLSDELRQLDHDVADLPLAPAAAIRARGRRRGRAQLAATTVAVAAVAVTAGVVLTRPDEPQPVADVPPPVACDVALPAEPAEVQVRVGGGDVAAELRVRGFTVLSGPPGSGTTALAYGPAAIGDAALLRAYLPGEVAMHYDAARRDAVVDLTLAPGADRLATTIAINQALVEAGEPTPPPGC
ncbi:LytR C-terminal domain-containing protein [Symbioplanes lichenis]|uniref:LytR C-terminal domain-containing protein n=1 Tax=Symbioplanes lichenis TaxID=1629072 RepID=UPI0027389350|nr:LytR C-terminal domain-containing protein [Actinoplanes lichenis]